MVIADGAPTSYVLTGVLHKPTLTKVLKVITENLRMAGLKIKTKAKINNQPKAIKK